MQTHQFVASKHFKRFSLSLANSWGRAKFIRNPTANRNENDTKKKKIYLDMFRAGQMFV